MKTAKTVILVLLFAPLAIVGILFGAAAVQDLWHRIGPAQNE